MARPKDFCRDCWALWEAQQVELVGPGDVQPPRASEWSRRPVVADSGSRCATHWREEKARRKTASHEKRVQTTYGLGEGDYGRLYEMQGGLCAICRRANGRTRRLSVDHDHATGAVRGLLCRPCNTMLGHGRDSVEFFERAVEYLNNPPAAGLAREAIQAKWDIE